VIASRAEVLFPSDSSTASGFGTSAVTAMAAIIPASDSLVLRFYLDSPLANVVAARSDVGF
jgi:hypothetical protein